MQSKRPVKWRRGRQRRCLPPPRQQTAPRERGGGRSGRGAAAKRASARTRCSRWEAAGTAARTRTKKHTHTHKKKKGSAIQTSVALEDLTRARTVVGSNPPPPPSLSFPYLAILGGTPRAVEAAVHHVGVARAQRRKIVRVALRESHLNHARLYR